MAEIIKVNPIFGLGMANYYWYTPLFPILGYRVSFNSHNNYIDIIAQTGLVGLICFLWFFGELWLFGWHIRNRVPEGFPRAYVMGSLAGIVGTLSLAALGDWVIPFVYNVGLEGFRASMFGFLFLGGLVAIANIFHINPSKSIEL
jgi:O-antigen ligase